MILCPVIWLASLGSYRSLIVASSAFGKICHHCVICEQEPCIPAQIFCFLSCVIDFFGTSGIQLARNSRRVLIAFL